MEESVQQQSSTYSTLRAAVMLCLLFCIPAVAIFDLPLRELVRDVVYRDAKPKHASTKPRENEGEEEAWPGAAQDTAAPAKNSTPAPPVASGGGQAAGATSQVPPADPGLIPGPHGSATAWSETPPQAGDVESAPMPEAWQTAPPVSEGRDDATFDSMHRRLEQLGATYYLLETWGRGGALYRFHCKMAIGENPNFTRQFEATDSNPMVAMKRVLGEVEAWHAKRRY